MGMLSDRITRFSVLSMITTSFDCNPETIRGGIRESPLGRRITGLHSRITVCTSRNGNYEMLEITSFYLRIYPFEPRYLPRHRNGVCSRDYRRYER